MKISVYTVYDKAAGTFATPFFAVNDDVAKRNFRFSLKKLDDMFIVDMELYNVGWFDTETAFIRYGINDSGDIALIDDGEHVLSERELEKKNSEVKQ